MAFDLYAYLNPGLPHGPYLMRQQGRRYETIEHNDGFWARCRKPFVCERTDACGHRVNVGDWYYNTSVKGGFHYWADVRWCRACAEERRGK